MSAARIRVVAPLTPFRTPLQRWLAYSMTVHLIVVLAIVFVPLVRSRNAKFEPTMNVMLSPAPPSPVQSQPPPPKPQPREEPKVETPPKPPERREEVQAKAAEPKINPDKVDQPAAEPAEQVEAPAPEGEGVAEQDAPGVPQLPGMEGAQYDWYRAAINRALSLAWRKPFVQTAEQSLDVLVGFEILRDGSVRGVQIVSSSGFPALDRSAERAVYDASLPPLPRNFREPTQPARVIFRYFSDSM